MKIATWNVQRPKVNSAKNSEIKEKLKNISADILILTETNDVIDVGHEYSCMSNPLPIRGDFKYGAGEKRTTIWSNYPLKEIETANPETTSCALVATPHGDLCVYATIIGIEGRKHKARFYEELNAQLFEWKKLGKDMSDLCIAGDFNICWQGKYYPRAGSEEISSCFDELGITNLTDKLDGNIDHIAISNSFVANARVGKPSPWNLEKGLRKPTLSDHIGVSVTIDFS